MMTDDFCFNCKYSYVVDNMQGCVWESGLKSRQVKCNRYKWSWKKALLPYAVMLFIFLQETFVVYDVIQYDNGTIADHNDIWLGSTSALERKTDYSEFKEPSTSDILLTLASHQSHDICIEFDYLQVDGALYRYFFQFSQSGSYKGGASLGDAGNLAVGQWHHIKIEIPSTSGSILINSHSKNMTWDINTLFEFRFWSANDITTQWFKNFKMYKV